MDNKKRIENAIKWIDRLLVTRLKQGELKLGDKESGFCCLGLGCYIFGIPYLCEDLVSAEFRNSVGLLTPIGKSKAGIDSHASLAELNDSGYSFNRIAKLIKGNLDTLFEEEVAKGIASHYK